MSISSSALPWEIWLAYLRFDDHPEVGKVRPVVILDNQAIAIVVAKVTTATPNEQFEYAEIRDWESAGLVRPSCVQTTPLFQLSVKDLLRGKPLGRLSNRDRVALMKALSSK